MKALAIYQLNQNPAEAFILLYNISPNLSRKFFGKSIFMITVTKPNWVEIYDISSKSLLLTRSKVKQNFLSSG